MIASEAGPAHLTVLIGFFQRLSMRQGKGVYDDCSHLDFCDDIEAIFPASICKIYSHESIGNSVSIACSPIERIAEVEAWVWDSGYTAS